MLGPSLPIGSVMASREMKLRYAATCASCGAALPPGTLARWDGAAKVATCSLCSSLEASIAADGVPLNPMPLDRGTAGRSARGQYERRSERERAKKQQKIDEDEAWRQQAKTERPIRGRIASAFTPRPTMTAESPSTRSWGVGAVGEEKVGAMLELCAELVVIHDRRVPGSKANIDHLVVAPTGIFVVDPKRYRGQVHKRDVGSLFRPDVRLFVGRRDCSKQVAGVRWQGARLRAALGDVYASVPIYMTLCFVDSQWGAFTRPFVVDGVWVGWPRALRAHLTNDGPICAAQREEIARTLVGLLRAA